MKQIIKKNIAREFLFLLGSLVLFLIIMLTWLGLVQINHLRENKLENELKQLGEKPIGLTTDQAMKVHDALNEEGYDLGGFDNFRSTLSDEVKRKKLYLYFQEEGYDLGRFDNFKITENENRLEAYLENKQLLKEKLVGIKNSIFNKRVKYNIFLNVLIGLLSITFILRYLIYATKWSIRQIRQ